MQKNHIGKILAVGIIVLFIGVGIHPAFAVDTNQSMVNKTSEEECWECREVNDRQLVILERQLNRLKGYTNLLLVLSRYNPEIKEICNDILNVLDSDRPICDVLENILFIFENFKDVLEEVAFILTYYFGIFFISYIILGTIVLYTVTIIYNIGFLLRCDWATPEST